MKTAKKVLLSVMAGALLVAGSVAGTLAWLSSQAAVENTFTAGNVTITMTETDTDEYGVGIDGNPRVTENQYTAIPGQTYTKDPIIYVAEKSEPCYLFVKVENGFDNTNPELDFDDNTTIEAQMGAKGWERIETNSNIWRYTKDGGIVDARIAQQNIPVFDTFTLSSEKVTSSNIATVATKEIKVTAFAIQAGGEGINAMNLETAVNQAKATLNN